MLKIVSEIVVSVVVNFFVNTAVKKLFNFVSIVAKFFLIILVDTAVVETVRVFYAILSDLVVIGVVNTVFILLAKIVSTYYC